jgi:hypothetical protein
MRAMAARLQISAHEGIDEGFLTQMRKWANEVLERTGSLTLPPMLCLTVWKDVEEMRVFYQREREALGVMTGEEADFLATHEAWRGYPRIHLCEERLMVIPDDVVRGAVHHEMGHALHHGSAQFYTFRFSNDLQKAGRSGGLDLPLLQQCVYFVSVAIKDREVVQWLADIGLDSGQRALLEHLVSDTEEDRQAWGMIHGSPPLKTIALAAFLKTLLPIEAMISAGVNEAIELRNRWNEAYGWLHEGELEGLYRLARHILSQKGETFQDRLERATLRLIAESL